METGGSLQNAHFAPGLARASAAPGIASGYPQSFTAQSPRSLKKPKLLAQMREAMRARHYSPRTERTYCHWVKQFVLFHGKRHPAEMAEPEINRFLTYLATERRVSASTQNQALSALLFLYRHVLLREIGSLGDVVRTLRPRRLPVVLTHQEAREVIAQLRGAERLAAVLLAVRSRAQIDGMPSPARAGDRL